MKYDKKFGPLIFWAAGLLIIPIWLISFPETTIRHNAKPFLIYPGQLAALIGFAFFALSFLLAARIKRMEHWFGGLDKMYHTHHLMGKTGFFLILLHPVLLAFRWLPDDVSKSLWYLFPVHNRTEINLGSWSLWILIILILLTIVVKIPYDKWKLTHKLLGVPFLLGVLHVIFLDWPLNANITLSVYLVVLMVTGLGGWIYVSFLHPLTFKKNEYQVTAVDRLNNNILDIKLNARNKPLNFVPGQFGFFSFRQSGITGEAHPYTICSAPGDSSVRIMVKALGDYTRNLYKELKPGASAFLDGPYGMFNYAIAGDSQIWIAGGVGIAPYLSWIRNLETLKKSEIKVQLFYCVNTANDAVWLDEFKKAENRLDHFHTHLICRDEKGLLNAADLGNPANKHIFICGPKEMRQKLVKELSFLQVPESHIHFEDFDFK